MPNTRRVILFCFFTPGNTCIMKPAEKYGIGLFQRLTKISRWLMYIYFSVADNLPRGWPIFKTWAIISNHKFVNSCKTDRRLCAFIVEVYTWFAGRIKRKFHSASHLFGPTAHFYQNLLLGYTLRILWSIFCTKVMKFFYRHYYRVQWLPVTMKRNFFDEFIWVKTQ